MDDVTDAAGRTMMTVYLAYAEDALRQHYDTVTVPVGTTLYEALASAGWLVRFSELSAWCEAVKDVRKPTANDWYVGVYAQKKPLDYCLQPFDRIEVYRRLHADPMSQRKYKSQR